MFGLDKLKDLKKNAEEAKNRMELIEVTGKAGDNLVTVVCSGNRRIKSVEIAPSVLSTADKEALEKLILEATNDALEQADKVMESEMRSFMPNIPGM